MAEKETGEDPFLDRKSPYGMAKTIVSIDQGGEEFAVAGAHLPVFPEEIFQPGMKWHFSAVSVDDGCRVTELVT
jgi:hypothetical protein